MKIGQQNFSLQAASHFDDLRDDTYPWRAIVRGMTPAGDWITLEVFEWSNEKGAHIVAADCASDYLGAFEAVHYYVGEVA